MKISPTEKRTDGILLTRQTVNDYENRRGKVKNLNLNFQKRIGQMQKFSSRYEIEKKNNNNSNSNNININYAIYIILLLL